MPAPGETDITGQEPSKADLTCPWPSEADFYPIQISSPASQKSLARNISQIHIPPRQIQQSSRARWHRMKGNNNHATATYCQQSQLSTQAPQHHYSRTTPNSSTSSIRCYPLYPMHVPILQPLDGESVVQHIILVPDHTKVAKLLWGSTRLVGH